MTTITQSSDVKVKDRRQGFMKATSQIAWSAIFAGMITSLVVQVLLALLGFGIGIATVNPADPNSETGSGLAVGAGIWWTASTLVALFAGGWVAGHMAGTFKRADGGLHGFVTWGLTTLLSIGLLTTAVGSLVGGTLRIVGQGLGMAGQSVMGAASSNSQGDSMKSILNEAEKTLRQTKNPQLQPEALKETAGQALEDTERAAVQSPPGQTGAVPLETMLKSLLSDTASEVDKESVVNVLMARTDMTRAEATARVERWQALYAQAQGGAENMEQQAQLVANDVTDGMAKASIMAFFALLLGAIAAGAGGAVGSMRDRRRIAVLA